MRDLGLAHALAVTKEEASGNRIIVSAGPYKWQDFGESNRVTDRCAISWLTFRSQ